MNEFVPEVGHEETQVIKLPDDVSVQRALQAEFERCRKLPPGLRVPPFESYYEACILDQLLDSGEVNINTLENELRKKGDISNRDAPGDPDTILARSKRDEEHFKNAVRVVLSYLPKRKGEAPEGAT